MKAAVAMRKYDVFNYPLPVIRTGSMTSMRFRLRSFSRIAEHLRREGTSISISPDLIRPPSYHRARKQRRGDPTINSIQVSNSERKREREKIVLTYIPLGA